MKFKGIEIYDIQQLDSLKDEKYVTNFLNGQFPELLSENKSNIFTELINASLDTSDIELAIKLDNHPFFSNLTKVEANDESLWATLNIEYFNRYTYNRWLEGKSSKQVIKDRVFKNGKMLYNRNSLARLWWITKMTKDVNLSDPYQLTKLVLENGQIDQSVMESSLAKNQNLLKNILTAIYTYEANNQKLTTIQVKKYMKELNKLGGTFVLDIMQPDYFYNILNTIISTN